MTRWTIDFSALRESLRWLPDDQICGARTQAGYTATQPLKPGDVWA